jgi:hypothetical protein
MRESDLPRGAPSLLSTRSQRLTLLGGLAGARLGGARAISSQLLAAGRTLLDVASEAHVKPDRVLRLFGDDLAFRAAVFQLLDDCESPAG